MRSSGAQLGKSFGWRSDDAMMFLGAGAVVVCLSAVVWLVAILIKNAETEFWPEPVYQWVDSSGEETLVGQIVSKSDLGVLINQGWLGGESNKLARVPRSANLGRSAPAELVRVDHAALGKIYGVWLETPKQSFRLVLADKTVLQFQEGEVLRWYRPNALDRYESWRVFSENIESFLFRAPINSSTMGGVYPAIVGTVIMVMLMTVFVMPLGVLGAVYLHEYAAENRLTRFVRVGVYNLAGIPSIVYGVFGLGLFVYGLGGEIDQIWYRDSLPAPTFGEPGLLWAALTLALLTLPVVIVATEEGLARIPVSLREASYALGATRAETLFKLVLPLTLPAMMTGLILAIARAAGEVAPLMLVGVVEFAPELPVSTDFPYLHLDQKFMHLGYHIYDLGFQSVGIEATQSRVYASALLLFLIVLVLNAFAIWVRARFARRYKQSL